LKVKLKELTLHWAKSLKNIAKAFSLPGMGVIFSTVFLFQGGFTFFTTFFGVFLITKFGWSQGAIGNYFAFVGIWIALSQALITRRVNAKWNEKQILRVSLIATGLFILAQFLPNSTWGLLLIVPFFAVFNGLSQANLTSLVSGSVGKDIQGEILGINASVQALAQTIPPILSGYIAASIGATVPIVVAGITVILAGILFVTLYHKSMQLVPTN
jgi:MFS transporter, DHA1 family, tetracycline resistance protein